ncbi:LacI family DNA-binding transcriptional regulator [uncultured Vibrio sp.]|uniref:LacI family DNA-binding transcriptional regulator n=1 Tax=uncultured Vibrio sp. TaxID=114054 RepID=UPI0025CE8DAC|nr:LacI family DNA-binding transcriptional regulator [uncultured Vibrio sp.]
MKKITIADIAKESGMSVYAVSRTLTGKSGVSENSRQHIIDTAKGMGYVPKGQHETHIELIRLVVPTSDLGAGEHYMTVISGAEEQAKALGVKLEIVTTGNLEDVSVNSVSGYIIAGALSEGELERLSESSRPIISLYYLPIGTQVDNIFFSDLEIGAQACRHFLDNGHNHIAVIRDEGTKFSAPSMKARVDGFHLEANHRTDVLSQSLCMEDTLLLKERLVAMKKEEILPSAFFCVNDYLAERLISLLSELQLRVPHDVSVIGFGNYTISKSVIPPLTTIQAPMKTMGQVAVQQIVSQLRLPYSVRAAMRIALTSDMIVRKSTSGRKLSP